MTNDDYKKGKLAIDFGDNKGKGGRTDRLSSQDIPVTRRNYPPYPPGGGILFTNSQLVKTIPLPPYKK